jgi:MoaA/NifB/PqqE/SkfB family radical SAM enzyme
MTGKNFIHTVELHFSNKCTGDCICCSKAHGGSNPEFVTERVVDATIRNLQFIEFNWLQLGGDGDSFLNPVFIPSLRKYRQVFPGKGLCLFTNGAMLTKEMTDILTSEKLLDDIQTRLDSLDPELYRQSTGLSLERVIDNIKYFFLQNTFTRYHIIYFPLYAYKHVCREQLGKEQPTHWHRINEDLLHDEAMEMKKFFYSLPRNPRMTEAQMNFRISPICLWGEREDIPPVTDKVCTQLPEYKGCFRNQIYVYPNGDLGCCAYDDAQNTFIVGNVLDHDHAIHDAWASDKRMQIIDDVRRGKYYGKYPCTNPVACGMYFVDKSVNYGSCYERNNTVSKVAR